MERLTGKVKYYDTTKGFGFIAQDNGEADVFVHSTSLQKVGLDTLKVGLFLIE